MERRDCSSDWVKRFNFLILKTLKMKKTQWWMFMVVVLFLLSCTSSKPDTTGVWVNKEKMQGKSFHKVFVVAMTADVDVKARMENDVAAAIAKKGYQVVKSMDVLPIDIKNPRRPTKEEIVDKVKTSGCDAVFIMAVLKKDESIAYTEGGTTYSKSPEYTWGNSYYGYYNHWYQITSTSSYYTNDKRYVMQTNLYDAASEEIMWSVQSEVLNPSSLEQFSKAYMNGLVKKLKAGGVLKK
jgi:hypothetical protein